MKKSLVALMLKRCVMSKDKTAQSRLSLILSMVIFGTIGVFRTWIPLPSGTVALARASIGLVFLLVFLAIKRQKLSFALIKKHLPALLVSGTLLGFNWICLFEGYEYTSVAAATLCYYMAPIFIILASPFVLKERLTLRKSLCVVAALAGMVLVSGVLQTGLSFSELKGVLFALAAAVMYAVIMLLNKKTCDVPSFERTVVQFASSAVVMLPYVIFTDKPSTLSFDTKTVLLLVAVGVIHTGVAYVLYFGSMSGLKAQTIALFSYLDPVLAVILSAALLRESVGVTVWVGAVLIIGAAVAAEFGGEKKAKE